MPPADATLTGTIVRTAPLHPVQARVRGWGGGPGARVSLLRPQDTEGVRRAVEDWRASAGAGWRAGAGGEGGGGVRPGAIARGMGRSYGDAAQLNGGLVLDTTRLKGFSLDRAHGTVTAGAGVTLGELLNALVPEGWMVPVVPGTQHVTVGGAIASDIHGKNHGVAGTFGSHVETLDLVTAEGEVLDLFPEKELFAATLGGMGLTGVITRATVRLSAVSGPWLSVDSDRVRGLDDALAALLASGGPHRVAWLDLLGSPAGRGIVTRAEHVDAPRPGRPTVRARATVPRRWPSGVLRPSAVRAFNELRFRRAPVRQRGHLESIGSHLFPLDGLDAWPRLYGAAGFVQYQLVVPFAQEGVLHTVIERLRRTRVPCYLAVLKDFGESGDAPLSFPIAGWTLALDFPRIAPGLDALLDGFDELVAGAGGRVYLSKDARMGRATLEAMYPRLDEWRRVREKADPERLWRSDLAQRTGLLG